MRVAELTGAPGDIVLMDLRVLHALAPNAGERPRMVLGQVLHRVRPTSDAVAQPR